MRRSPRDFMPTPLQRDLLQVALGAPAGSGRIWSELRPQFVLDLLEPGSFELLPLVYRALADSGVEEPLLPRLKGIYRRAGVRNTLQLERARVTAAILEEAAVPALFLQGAAFADRFYPDLGLRPTSASHVLVEHVRLQTAVWRALRVGWRPRADVPDGPDGRRYLFDDEGGACVLQPSVEFDFVTSAGKNASHRLWEGAERQPIGDSRADVPSATDALLVTIVSERGQARLRTSSGSSMPPWSCARRISTGNGSSTSPRTPARSNVCATGWMPCLTSEPCKCRPV